MLFIATLWKDLFDNHVCSKCGTIFGRNHVFFDNCWSKELYEITLATRELKRFKEINKILYFGKKLKIKCIC